MDEGEFLPAGVFNRETEGRGHEGDLLTHGVLQRVRLGSPPWQLVDAVAA